MNLVLIKTDSNSHHKSGILKRSNGMIKINGEYVIERIIRIGRINGIKRVFCIVNFPDPELEQYISSNDFGIPAKFIAPHHESYMHILFALASVHNKEPFLLANINSVFLESEFSEFVTYSSMLDHADGTIAVTRDINDEKPLGVAMNDEDIILKFNDSKDGYSWFNGGICYFSPQILYETKNAFLDSMSQIEQFLQLLIAGGYILKGFSFAKIIKIENAADIINADDLIRLNE